MRQYHDLRSAVPVFKCLGSDVRIEILELLIRCSTMSMTDIADSLHITLGTLSPHIKALSECGLITVTSKPGKRGVQKECSLGDLNIVLDPDYPQNPAGVYESEISVGHYAGYEVHPTCGLATPVHVIGCEDDPRFFSSPERISAGILWLGYGFVEYMIPNYIQNYERITELQISFEISSEAPGYCENWPSDISFFINDISLCTWTSRGDYGDIKALRSPQWWPRNWNQYGKLKVLNINERGTFIDGVQYSSVNLGSLSITKESPLKFRISNPGDSEHVGGFTLYGRDFGNHAQDIRVRMRYESDLQPECASV